ncbi:MAG: S8 family serine peptidase [Bryobacteraceae bacterium]|nr:S8 family serine peptidase [Bryobacteraceae bacterium]
MRRQLSVIFLIFLAASALFGQTEYRFSDGGHRTTLRLAEDEIFSQGNRVATANSTKWGSGRVITNEFPRRFARGFWAQDRNALAPVFYATEELPSHPKAVAKFNALPAAERERRRAAARRVMTAKLLVRIDASQTDSLSATQPTAFAESMLPGWMLVSYPDAFLALDAADWLTQRGGFEFTPVFSRVNYKRQVLQRAVNDILYPRQWHLQSTAFNLTMRNTWDIVTGKDINMVIVDDGLDINHEDISANAYALGQGLHANFNDGDPNDPSPVDFSEDTHGTQCAGLAAAVGFNNLGVVGVAPEVGLMGIRLIAGNATEEQNGIALAWQPKDLLSHVSSNSWGPLDTGKDSGRISALQLAGISKAARENRENRGTVIVISAGNGREEGDDQSYDAFSSTRFGIAVGAVNREGKQSSYSESGMGVAISAFGGETAPPAMMWTTYTTGQRPSAATSVSPVNYSDAMNGTSAAAPQISGVAALMLQRNPRLGYRDVKEILMRTANREGLEGRDPFVTNGGGFTLSHSFGAGLVNVAGAVSQAASWTNLGELLTVVKEDNVPAALPDDGRRGLVAEFDFSDVQALRVEHVEITFNIKHPLRGELSFQIESPSGMKSIARARPDDDNADFIDYLMTSVMHWGENSSGKWKVSVLDEVPGDAGRWDGVRVRIYGTRR